MWKTDRLKFHQGVDQSPSVKASCKATPAKQLKKKAQTEKEKEKDTTENGAIRKGQFCCC